jgi:ATP-dependent DNA ligase
MSGRYAVTAAVDPPHSASAADACKFGLEGIVSQRRDLPYQSGK